MGDRHVVALEVVVGHDLPVGGLRAVGLVVDAHRLHPVALDPLPQSPKLLGERRGVDVEIHEQEAAEALDARREKTEPALVQALDRSGLRDADQISIEPVGPPVIAAADRLAALAGAAQEPGAAVSADVAKRAEVPLPVSQHEHRLVAGARGEVAAGTGKLGDVARELPGALEDPFLLERSEIGIAVEARVEGGGHGG